MTAVMDIRDAEGAPVAEGVRVRTGTEEGTVLRITEPDDEVGPFVVVEYDGGETMHWIAQNWSKDGPLDFYRCDDIDVVIVN